MCSMWKVMQGQVGDMRADAAGVGHAPTPRRRPVHRVACDAASWA